MSSYESNNGFFSSHNSESRGSIYTSFPKSYSTYDSESRYDDGESRYEKSNSSYDSGEDIREVSNNTSSFENSVINVRDIDELIRRLESKQFTHSDNEGINKALEARRKKIEELKTLAVEAKKIADEKELFESIQKENSELDDIILSIKKGLHR